MRYLSPTLYAAILIFFALPFGAVVDCEGFEHFEWTGYDLVTASVEAPPEEADQAAEVEKRWMIALPVLAAAVAGLLLGILQRARHAGWLALGGLVGMVAMVVAIPIADEEPRRGYVLTFLAFASLTLLHGIGAVLRWWRRRRTARSERNEPVGASLR